MAMPPESSGIGFDTGDFMHVRMAPQFRTQCAVCIKDRVAEESFFCKGCIERQTLVARRKDESIPLRPIRFLRINPHDLKVEGGHDVYAGEGPADVPHAAGSHQPQNVFTVLNRNFFKYCNFVPIEFLHVHSPLGKVLI
jgi:hypothetical protein